MSYFGMGCQINTQSYVLIKLFSLEIVIAWCFSELPSRSILILDYCGKYRIYLPWHITYGYFSKYCSYS